MLGDIRDFSYTVSFPVVCCLRKSNIFFIYPDSCESLVNCFLNLPLFYTYRSSFSGLFILGEIYGTTLFV